MTANNNLLCDIRDYLEGVLVTWGEFGSKEEPTEEISLLNDVRDELALGNCPVCHGPMVRNPVNNEVHCGSWLYMEGGCPPVPKI